MANYTPSTLTGDLAPVNAELEKIASAINDQADRNPAEGEANQMENTLDMNSQSLINLPEPVNANDAARLVDVQVAVSTGLPDQTGNAGKFLSTDGEVASWEETLTSVNGQTGVVVLDTDDIDDSASTNKYVTQSQIDKIDDLEQTTLTSVANVTALRSFEPTADNQQISLVEHTSGGKGGGVFYFDATDSTTADNNGTVIVTGNNARWKRIYEQLDVTMFGAIGDGTTDDQSAIQNADDYAAQGDGNLFFPNNKYLSNTTITKSRETLWYGQPGFSGSESFFETRQQGSTIVSGITDATPLIDVSAPGLGVKYNINNGIRDMTIQGDLTLSTTSNGISIVDNTRGMLLQRVNIKNFNKGIEAVTGGLLYLKNCFLSHCKWTLHMTQMSDCWFDSCHFGSSNSNVVSNSIFAGGAGVYHDTGQNLKFTACRLQVQYQGAGGQFIGSRGVQFDAACQYDLNGQQGLRFIGCNDVIINGYFFKNNYENYIVSPSPGTKFPHLAILSTGETCTADPTTDLITVSGTYRYRVTQVQFATTGTLPGGLSADTIYWTGYNTLTTKYVYTNEHDAQNDINRIDITSAGTGTQYIIMYVSNFNISAVFNGVTGQTEDCGSSILLQANELSGGSGIIENVNITNSSLAADNAIDFTRQGAYSSISNVTVVGNSVDSRTNFIDSPSEINSGLYLSNNTNVPQIYEINDNSYGWRTASGITTITANNPITALKFVNLFNDGAYEGQEISVIRKGSGASSVTVRNDSLATINSLAVNERGDYYFDGTDWQEKGIFSI